MSSAFYPLGMNSYNNRLPQGGYESWKGKGIYSNPVGVTAGNIRPLTNNDPANSAPAPFGKPRPLKHYRRGINVSIPVLTADPNNPKEVIEIQYYANRSVKSAVQDKMVQQMLDNPGRYTVKENNLASNGNPNDCNTCKGAGIVSDWYPINNLTEKPQPNVTNPLLCCSQQRKAKRRVIYASTNLKKNYYTTTEQYLYNRCQTFDQRSFNFENGIINPEQYNVVLQYPGITDALLATAKPGSALSYYNLYVGNCNPNGVIDAGATIATISRFAEVLYQQGIISEPEYANFKQLAIDTLEGFRLFLDTLPEENRIRAIAIVTAILENPYNGALINGPSNPRGCKRVYYKPNNPQFAQQGGVSSSTRMLKLNVTTIEKNAANIRRLKGAGALNQLGINQEPFVPFIYKEKAPTCQLSTYSGNPFFFQGQHQNKQICSKPTGQPNTYVSINQHSAGNYIGATQP